MIAHPMIDPPDEPFGEDYDREAYWSAVMADEPREAA